MTIWDSIFFAFWFFLPAGLANMFPIFAAHAPWLKRFDYPIDFYKNYNGQRLLGANKTLRGLIVGIIVAILTVLVQRQLSVHSQYLQSLPVNYLKINPYILGLLLGSGAL